MRQAPHRLRPAPLGEDERRVNWFVAFEAAATVSDGPRATPDSRSTVRNDRHVTQSSRSKKTRAVLIPQQSHEMAVALECAAAAPRRPSEKNKSFDPLEQGLRSLGGRTPPAIGSTRSPSRKSACAEAQSLDGELSRVGKHSSPPMRWMRAIASEHPARVFGASTAGAATHQGNTAHKAEGSPWYRNSVSPPNAQTIDNWRGPPPAPPSELRGEGVFRGNLGIDQRAGPVELELTGASGRAHMVDRVS